MEPTWADIVMAISSLLSCSVTSAGVVFAGIALLYVARQVRETRLAAGMECLVDLYKQWSNLSNSRKSIGDVIEPAKWEGMSDSEVVTAIKSNPEAISGYGDISIFFETIGVLVKGKALTEKLTYEVFGGPVMNWWKRLRPMIKDTREFYHDKRIYEHFEWLNNRFCLLTN